MTDNSAPPKTVMDLAPSLKTSGFRLVDAGELTALFNQIFSVTPSVAATGTVKATAKPLVSATNTVLSASAAQNGVILPAGLLGKRVVIVNSTAVGLSVYPNGSDLIIPSGGGSPGTLVAQAPNTSAAYICIAQVQSPTLINYWQQVAGAA